MSCNTYISPVRLEEYILLLSLSVPAVGLRCDPSSSPGPLWMPHSHRLTLATCMPTCMLLLCLQSVGALHVSREIWVLSTSTRPSRCVGYGSHSNPNPSESDCSGRISKSRDMGSDNKPSDGCSPPTQKASLGYALLHAFKSLLLKVT